MAEPYPNEIAGFPALSAQPAESDREPGGRPALVFLHGSFTNHKNFANYLHFFSTAGFECHAASHRGRSGVRPYDLRGVRIEDYLEDARSVIEAVGSECVVVGHSLGGLLAQKVAEAGECQAAVLLSPAPAAMLTAQPRSLPALLPYMPKIMLGLPFLPSLGAISQIALNRVPAAERQSIYEGFVPESGIAFRQMITGKVRVEESKVLCPVLCVAGREDRIISSRLNRNTASKYGAELKEYPGHGHWLTDEPGWETPAQDISRWLERNISTRRSVG